MENRKRKIFILIICAITLMLASIFGTYAYFMVSINNDRRQEAAVDTGTMRLRFADGDEGINATLLPNESITKKFTLENTGTLDATVSIEWLEMINTYTEGSLTYTLEYSENQDGEYTEIVSKTNVPTSNTEFTSTLVPDITIPVGKKYYYNLEITFGLLEEVDQTKDLNAKFSSKFIVNQPSTNRKYTLTIDPNGGIIDGSSEIRSYSIMTGDTREILTPSNEGTKFVGWKVSGYESSLSEGILTVGKSNTKVVAEWETFNAVEAVRDISNGRVPRGVMSGTPDFVTTAMTDEGVFAMEDDYGMSYYYRGAVTNNYLKFGDFCWRIIRVNGNGTLRIMYDGTSCHANGEGSADRAATRSVSWFVNDAGFKFDTKHVGWMYGGSKGEASTSREQAQRNETNSDTKIATETWYINNILNSGLKDYIDDTLFCNDRTLPGKDITKLTWDTGLGYGLNPNIYGPGHRVSTYGNIAAAPQFKCPHKNDAFTVSDKDKGNCSSTYPVGLITADEASAAGGVSYNKGLNNNKYYLYDPIYGPWTMSPIAVGENLTPAVGTIAHTGKICNSGMNANTNSSGDIFAIKPVINLKSEYVSTMIGTGTLTDPFRFQE